MKKAIIFITIAAMLGSCYTAKKAENQVNRANDKFPQIVAELARDKYPCTEILKGDTAIIYQDSVIYIDCPEVSQSPFEVLRFDTINKVVTKIIRVPVTLPIQTKTITRWFEDSAKLKLAAIELDKSNAEIAALQVDRDKYKAKSDRAKKENWIWRIIALVLMGWFAFRIFKRR